MTDAQTWTTLIGLLTLLSAALAFVFSLMPRTVVAEVRSGFAEMRTEIVELRGEVNRRIDELDADVQAITRRLMDGPDPS
ncbi:MAG: hypothetical protein ACR2FE_00625 [Aeromicrobium sp.]